MLKRIIRHALLAVTTALALISCNTEQSFGEKEGAAKVWPNMGGSYGEIGFSRLHQIDDGNVDDLGLARSCHLDDEVTLEATLLAVDGVIYFTGGTSSVSAVDGNTGKLLWQHDP